MRSHVAELADIRKQAHEGPEGATEVQKAKGKLTARERIALLLDEDSFHEVEALRRHRATGFGIDTTRPYTDGVIAGWGTVEGRTVFLYAHDFRIIGATLCEAHATKIHKIMDMAVAAGVPLVSLNDGAGARIQEGVNAMAGYGGAFRRNTLESGVIPQISVMLGPCASGVLTGTDGLHLHGPRHRAVPHRARCHQGGHGRGDLPRGPGRRERARRDLRARALRLRRRGDLPGGGPLSAAHAAEQQFLPGVDQEHGGIIRHGAKLLYAYCDATVPRVSVVVRKAYGGAYIVMDSQSIGADLTYAWPANEIAVMGAESAANVIFRRQISEAPDPEARHAELVKEYKAELMHPYYAAERGLIDDVIDPADTRTVLIDALRMLRTKHAESPARKHSNPPQ